MAIQSIFATEFGQTVLVFVLVFTLIFGILQKSKILGEGKAQLDALVSLAIGLIVISFGSALEIIRQLIPFLSVGLVILLVFMLMFGFIHKGALELKPGLIIGLGIVIGLAVIVAVLIVTDGWNMIVNWFSGTESPIIGNIILIAVVIGAIAVAFGFGEKSGGKSSG